MSAEVIWAPPPDSWCGTAEQYYKEVAEWAAAIPTGILHLVASNADESDLAARDAATERDRRAEKTTELRRESALRAWEGGLKQRLGVNAVTEAEALRMQVLYTQGRSPGEIAEEMKRDPKTVGNHLRRAGHRLNDGVTPALHARIVEELRQGRTNDAIAEKLKLSLFVVQRVARATGFSSKRSVIGLQAERVAVGLLVIDRLPVKTVAQAMNLDPKTIQRIHDRIPIHAWSVTYEQ